MNGHADEIKGVRGLMCFFHPEEEFESLEVLVDAEAKSSFPARRLEEAWTSRALFLSNVQTPGVTRGQAKIWRRVELRTIPAKFNSARCQIETRADPRRRVFLPNAFSFARRESG